jgi:hypothetical protein
MKLYKQIILILIIFFKTGTLLSEDNLFNVNNIKLEKKDKISNSTLADKAIKTGFTQLITKILLEEDKKKLSNIEISSIKQLVTYYQISNTPDEKNDKEILNFNITFDKEKIHNLFFQKGISYSDISDKELFILPILIKNNEIHIFNNNFFYNNWNKIYESDLIEFILPLENIEIIETINKNIENLINLEIKNLFKEYFNKNLALILIEDNKEKIYIKTIIQEKNISKNLKILNQNLSKNQFYKKIITETKKELINIVKMQNQIDIRTPSFLQARLKLSNKTNFVDINSRLKKIDLIENVYVQNFNKDYMRLRIKYLGKLEKIINQLKKNNINLKLENGQWIIKSL